MLHRRPGLRAGLLLAPPMLWLGVAYLGALAALFVTAFWGQNSFTGEVERTCTLRTIGIAALVTVVDALIAFPVAFYMAKVASRRTQGLLVVAVLTPLWASY